MFGKKNIKNSSSKVSSSKGKSTTSPKLSKCDNRETVSFYNDVDDVDSLSSKMAKTKISLSRQKGEASVTDKMSTNDKLWSKYGHTFAHKCRQTLFPINDVSVYAFKGATHFNLFKHCVLFDLTTGEQKICSVNKINVPEKQKALRVVNRFTFLDTKISFCDAQKVPGNDGFVLAFTGSLDFDKDDNKTLLSSLLIMMQFYDMLSCSRDVSRLDGCDNSNKQCDELHTLISTGSKQLLKSCLKLAKTLEASAFERFLIDLKKKKF